MSNDSSTTETATVAASVAPEDLKCGSYVTVLNELVEFPSFLWCDCVASRRDELVRVRFLHEDSGLPLKIKAICLPFVFVKSPLGQFQTLDVRRVQLVRLRPCYAKTVWKSLRGKRGGQRPAAHRPFAK